MPTILLIEDAPIVREPLARLLRDEGFEVLAAGDGAEGFARLEGHAIDLVLLDVLMPHMDGVTFLEIMRRDRKLASLPVIAMTGISDSSKLARLRELGVKSILHKVRFTIDVLLNEVHEHLAQSVHG